MLTLKQKSNYHNKYMNVEGREIIWFRNDETINLEICEVVKIINNNNLIVEDVITLLEILYDAKKLPLPVYTTVEGVKIVCAGVVKLCGGSVKPNRTLTYYSDEEMYIELPAGRSFEEALTKWKTNAVIDTLLAWRTKMEIGVYND